ncbi:MAG: FAD-dependent oxidoreductase [Candidatus Limivicinus sp.]
MERHDNRPNRPNILKLATKISLESLTYTGIGYNDPEYIVLDIALTDEMCEVMNHMRFNTPRTAAEISRRCKKDINYVQEQINKLMDSGVVHMKHNAEGVETYYYTNWVPGIIEDILAKDKLVNEYPILADCFEEYTRLRFEALVPLLGRGMSFVRVMPVMSAIENNTHTAGYDEINSIIEKAKYISVGPCSCRRSRRLMGEGCGHLEDDMCMYLNDNALTFVRTGEHRLISKEEAYEILRRAEENGFVHEINQTPGFDSVDAICNCCGCSCYSLRVAELFRKPDGMRSNFTAVVDRNKCVACGECVETCQTNALRLGQKLPEIKPVKVEDENYGAKTSIFDKSTYNVHYRENRKDVVETGTSPCKAACPAHIPVQGYIKLASEGRYREALELIKAKNPFPAVCGRICNKACEEACTRAVVDSPVAIDDIKKFIAEKDLEAEHRYVPKMLNQIGKPYPQKVAVIGAGPAGMSCAYYLAVKGYPVTIFEKEDKPGGMLTLGIPSFRLDKKVVNSEIDVLRELGVEFRTGVEVGKDVTLPQLREQGFKAFYLGIGASKGVPVGCKGDDLPGVFTGIDFLRAVNLGEKPEVGSSVAVIGGGNVAIDVARTALRLGAKNVTIVYRRGRDEMPAADDEIQEAADEGVSFKFLASPAEILGSGKAEQLKVELMELGEADAKGRRKPVGTGKFEIMDVTAVISSIGQKIDLCGMDEGTGMKFGPKGNVIADAVTYQTGQPDIFAGGDVVTGPKFAIDAIAAGREAAISIHRFVHPGQSLIYGRDRHDYKPLDTGNVALALDSFDSYPRQHAKSGSPAEAKKTFKDLRGTLTEEQIKKEADRCLGCGCVVVDDYMCIGCGICTTRCKFDAIHLEKVSEYKSRNYYSTLSRVVRNVPKTIGGLVSERMKNKEQ